MKITPQPMTAKMEGDFVVFLIGMRINKLWKFWSWMPVFAAMPRMIIELSKNKQHGFLSCETWFARTIVLVQYWNSLEDLQAYAHNKDANHVPAWAAFNRKIGTSGDVGIWHETYIVPAGNHESVYVNMPKFGLAKAGEHIEAKGRLRTAKGRLEG